ncbi:MAG TPA: aminopeptidase P family protein [Bacteroidales bacterium]|nr:aminopeptidase P family protein [Bacteroidales bacterium]
MFSSEVYSARRSALREKIKSGIAVFTGNTEAPMNYPGNTYHFRQDSDFLYFFGLDIPGLTGVCDFDSGRDMLFGNDFDMDDIIWMGPQPTVKELASRAGINETHKLGDLENVIHEAVSKNRKVHFLPPYRGETKMTLGRLLKENPCQMKTHASVELIKAVVALRSIKEDVEVQEIKKAVDIAYSMHVTAMKMCREGVTEQEIFGAIEGIALTNGAGTSFPTILSINGQTLHNHFHGNVLRNGKMMVTDSGAETNMHYASDITRTTPVGGKFSKQQKEVYEIVLKANLNAIDATRPGATNRDTHFLACKVIASGLIELGLMKGNADDVVEAGAHALFMPHGIGHMMGLDVHDMEALGENFVGYNDEVKRSEQFGTAFLRFALPYKPGHVFTIEPGIYFIPELIQQWKAEGKYRDFINYDKLNGYMEIGGIRIEDDVLITPKGHQVLGKPIPKTVEEVEAICNSI